MKILRSVVFSRVVLVLLLLECAQHSSAQAALTSNVPHLELEMSSTEYRALNRTREVPFSHMVTPLEAILQVGEKNLKWVDFINLARSTSNKLEISSEATQGATPIEKYGACQTLPLRFEGLALLVKCLPDSRL